MRTILLTMAMSMLVPAMPAYASVASDFAKAWEARDKGYRAERPALEARAQTSAARAIEALLSDEPTAGDDLTMALTAAWSLSEIVGRGQTLWALREHMAQKPSAALSEMWLQGKVDELKRRQDEADMISAQMEMLKKRDTMSVKTWIAALEQLSMMYGSISGASAELTLISQNLGSFYRARSEERDRNARIWIAALNGLANAAGDGQRAMQARSARCARTGQC